MMFDAILCLWLLIISFGIVVVALIEARKGR